MRLCVFNFRINLIINLNRFCFDFYFFTLFLLKIELLRSCGDRKRVFATILMDSQTVDRMKEVLNTIETSSNTGSIVYLFL